MFGFMCLMQLALGADSIERAQALEEQGDDVGAVFVLEQAVKADPAWAMGRVELGRLELKQGAADTALHQLDIARSLAPENPRAHYLFALAAQESGFHNQSRRALEVALVLRQGYADAQMRLATMLVAEGDFRAAATELEHFLQKHPDANGARLQLADALERSGDKGGAERELRALLRLPALKVIAGRRLLSLLESQGKTAEAAALRSLVERPQRQLRELKPSGR